MAKSFVSPGVFVEEIDNSQLPKLPVAIGPLVIGRTRRIVENDMITVQNLQEQVEDWLENTEDAR